MPELPRGWEVASLGEAALLVTRGNRISHSLNRRIHQLARRLTESDTPGLGELVPAYCSLLVKFEPAWLDEEKLRDFIACGLREVEASGGVEHINIRHHIVPVNYGAEYAPDLGEVAAACGLSSAEVVELHSRRDYTVAFLGFLPGFAYMSKLDARIQSPRLVSPRQRVPAGSVGLAGFQTGVYPFDSPGGWQIIGRTSVRVWDTDRPDPALFAPGDAVTFVPTDERVSSTPPGGESVQPRHPAFEVLTGEGSTTIQDLGRPGWSRLGLGTGGVFDLPAGSRANELVGNDGGAAVLEMTWTGPTLRALRNLTIALDGADLGCIAGAMNVPLGISWFVRAGTVVRFASPRRQHGMRGYMSVAGGFDAPVVLGSRSTNMLAHFGGMDGRAVRVGNILGVVRSVSSPVAFAGRAGAPRQDDISRRDMKLRYVPFSGIQGSTRQAQLAFPKRTWLLTEQADRMGCRFRSADGGALPVGKAELASFGVVRGAIQLPPNGMPVVLGVDHQTTGGYPLLGVLAEADFPLLAQLTPGSAVEFVPVTIDEARRIGRT